MKGSIMPGFREVPFTGVIYVMHRAISVGYRADDPSWSNLGQGAPQTDSILGEKLARIDQVMITSKEHEYGGVSGEKPLREKIAHFYNTVFRQHKQSKYTWENVSVCGGCRLGLTRLVAALGNINMGHFLPDYTAYEELLSIFKSFIPIPILLDATQEYRKSNAIIEDEIKGRGLRALLMSNPCNPTGQVTWGEELNDLIKLACQYNCTFIIDEAYSHYIYRQSHEKKPFIVSAAEYIDNVNEDPIVIVDGVTKNWRYPGWRIGWVVGPKKIIHLLSSTASFLDGGPNHPFQNVVMQLLEPELVLSDSITLQNFFQQKRDYTLKRLYDMGLHVEAEPQGTFYVWINLSNLPAAINTGTSFFEACLKEKVITVPGVFFDVNPDKRRTYARYEHYSRLSFGPNLQVIKQGLDNIEKVIAKYK
jgi:aspartate/methionine/tyrosine aminotransferase